MNCEIQPLKDRRKAVDTLPPRGKVNEVRREWLVHEDGALAYRLQDEEFKQHLIGNKSRNHQIREDFPCAKEEQTREAQEAARIHQQWLQHMEEEDARVASEIAKKIEREEDERRMQLEEKDNALAKILQEKEQLRIERRKQERERRDLEYHTPRKGNLHASHQSSLTSSRALYGDDVAGCLAFDSTPGSRSPVYEDSASVLDSIGVPIQDSLVQPMRSCRLRNATHSRDSQYTPSPPPISEDEARRIQEEKDAELARTLQEQEADMLDPLTRDRLLAIETQDKELARLLEEKEKARLRRARERAKARAAAKRAAELEATAKRATERELADCTAVPAALPQPKPRYPDPDEIIPAPIDSDGSNVENIAMVIDPTYPRGSARHASKGIDSETSVDAVAPPYMPIQGQRRFPDKKGRSKDGCKQQ